MLILLIICWSMTEDDFTAEDDDITEDDAETAHGTASTITWTQLHRAISEQTDFRIETLHHDIHNFVRSPPWGECRRYERC